MRRLGMLAAAIAIALVAAGEKARADVAPGDVISAANKDKVKGLVPDEIYPYAVENFDGLNMTIVKPEDYPPHPKYVEATVAYACQASLDEKGYLVNYTAGQPFPYSEWATKATNHACDLKESDPQFALKLAWDVNYRWQGAGLNYPHWGFSYMRNFGNERWRLGQGEYRRTFFSHRADLLPATTDVEPNTDLEWAEFFDVKAPFDLQGTMFLLYRYTDGRADDTWAYVPALRRVRRIAAAQKSDSLLGTEFTLEDFYGFSGYVTDQAWEFKGESTKLGAMNTKRSCFPRNFEPNGATSFSRLGTESEFDACRFGPYKAMVFVDEQWQKRTAFELDDIPKQKGHPYSRKKMWYDKETMHPLFVIAYDRAGAPYKIISWALQWSEDSPVDGNKGLQVLNHVAFMIVNLQNNNSNTVQAGTANSGAFPITDTKRYYDTTRLKTQGH